tara:strand:+ start:6216 stop:6530 length:315 start_codon:yes stop_codon:yes gene_type:complete
MSDYPKQKLYGITSRLYHELRNNPEIIIKKLKGMHGEYDFSTEEITLDYRGELLPTLIHEYLHKWHPDANETWVLNEESRIVNALSKKQVKRIIYEFAAAICDH